MYSALFIIPQKYFSVNLLQNNITFCSFNALHMNNGTLLESLALKAKYFRKHFEKSQTGRRNGKFISFLNSKQIFVVRKTLLNFKHVFRISCEGLGLLIMCGKGR